MASCETSESPERRAYSWCFFSSLFAVVLPFWSVTPLSWAFVLYSLRTGSIWSYSYLGLATFAIPLCEVFFSVYHWHLAQYIASVSPCTPPASDEIQAAVFRLLKAGLCLLPEDNSKSPLVDQPANPEEIVVQLDFDDPRAVDFRNSFRTWFQRAPWSSVKLTVIRKWLYWSLFNAKMGPYETLPDARRQWLDQTLNLLQKRMGCTIPDGGDSANVRPMRLTIDPVQIMGRPLIFYAIIKAVNITLEKYYESKWDVRHGCHDGLEYLLRIPSGWDYLHSSRPLVFIHGLGMGLMQYHLLLSHLFETITDRPILVLLQPHISQDIFHPRFLTPMSRHQMSQNLAALLKSLGWMHVEYADEEFENEEERAVAQTLVRNKMGITLLSHSNGSYTHAWMLKEHPHLVTRSCFVDPVTFCSWEGDVCYNFLYRPPRTGIELLMKYFVGTELGAANLLQRHFDWVSNSLWFEEIPNARDPSKTLFLLGGKDDIVDAERVRKYLASHGVRENLWFDPGAKHGDALLTGSPGHSEVLRWLHEKA